MTVRAILLNSWTTQTIKLYDYYNGADYGFLHGCKDAVNVDTYANLEARDYAPSILDAEVKDIGSEPINLDDTCISLGIDW